MVELANHRRATPAQLALAWLLKRSPVMLPIPGTSSVAHLEDNMREWNGDSRGHWEGNTLVVDTTNYTPKQLGSGSRKPETEPGASAGANFVPNGISFEHFHLIEHFVPVSPTRIHYYATLAVIAGRIVIAERIVRVAELGTAAAQLPTDHLDRQAGCEHDGGGLGVAPDDVFGRRRDVAFAAGVAAHGDAPRDVKVVKLEPRRPRYQQVLADGERMRQAFLQRLDKREKEG